MAKKDKNKNKNKDKNKDKKQGTKALIRKAGPTISKKELNKIVKSAGSTRAALNKISSVQKSKKTAGKTAPSINSGAANMLIRQAQSTPGGVYQLGSSKLASTIQGMAGTPAGPMRQGQRTAATPGTGRVPGGMVIKPGGGLAVKQQPLPKSPYAGAMGGKNNDQGLPKVTTEDPVVPDPNQALLDAIAVLQGDLGTLKTDNETLRTEISGKDQYFQDILNQTQQTAQQQMADLGNMFNQQMAQSQYNYDMQIQQQNLLAQQEEEAARAFMINQGRSMMPANLQIGATYGGQQLAGTQGFKRPDRRPTLTPAQTATAFTAPTLSATAATTPMVQPSVLNI